MAHVKLFRVTEFAESVFQSPLAHRTALHPLGSLAGSHGSGADEADERSASAAPGASRAMSRP